MSNVDPDVMRRVVADLQAEEIEGAEHLLAVMTCAGLVPEDESLEWWSRLEACSRFRRLQPAGVVP